MAAMLACTTMHQGRIIDVYDFDPDNPSLRSTFKLEDDHVFNKDMSANYVFSCFERVIKGVEEGQSAIVDLGAGLDKFFLEFLNSIDVVNFAKDHFRFSVLMPISTLDSLGNARTASEAVKGLPLILVCNQYFSELVDAKEHPVWKQLIETGVKTVDLPNLGTVVQHAKKLRIPLHKMIGEPNVSRLWQHASLEAMKRFDAAFEQHKDLLP